MTANPIFSSYRTGENRVTASMIAVFERIGVDAIERILGAALGDLERFELVRFQNQLAETGASSIPDASISGSFRYLIEVKTEANIEAAALRDQVARHEQLLDGSHTDERLLVVTPDPEEPAAISEVGKRVRWLSFATLDGALGELLADEHNPLPAESAFLVRELRRLFSEEGLIDHADTVIVAAGSAYPAYLAVPAYVCPPDRSFRRGLTHLGFYAEGEIKPEVAKIRAHYGSPADGDSAPIRFTQENAQHLREAGNPTLAEVIESFLALPGERDREDEDWQVFVLSPREDDATVKLPRVISNTTRTHDGTRPWAWTLSKRYTALSALRKAAESDAATTRTVDESSISPR